MPIRVTIPLLNPNEPEALIASLPVQEGQYVRVGEVLCTLETTKSTAEVTAELDGYIAGLSKSEGQIVSAGDGLCYLTDDAGWKPSQLDGIGQSSLGTPTPAAAKAANTLAEIRISKPALALAQAHNLELSQLPPDIFITETVVRDFLKGQESHPKILLPESVFDETAILVYGGGGHGKSVIELLRAIGAHKIVGLVDDVVPLGENTLGVTVLGGAEFLPELFARGVRLAVNAVGGIGNPSVRVRIFQRLAEVGFHCPALVHPTAYVEPSAHLENGVQVFPLAYVGSDSRLGIGVIVNTGAIVSHDCQVEDYANLSPGAILAGKVVIGSGVLVGMGSTINLQVHVGKGSRIGNGATIKSDVPENTIVRAGSIWPA